MSKILLFDCLRLPKFENRSFGRARKLFGVPPKNSFITSCKNKLIKNAQKVEFQFLTLKTVKIPPFWLLRMA